MRNLVAHEHFRREALIIWNDHQEGEYERLNAACRAYLERIVQEYSAGISLRKIQLGSYFLPLPKVSWLEPQAVYVKIRNIDVACAKPFRRQPARVGRAAMMEFIAAAVRNREAPVTIADPGEIHR